MSKHHTQPADWLPHQKEIWCRIRWKKSRSKGLLWWGRGIENLASIDGISDSLAPCEYMRIEVWAGSYWADIHEGGYRKMGVIALLL